MKQKSLQRLREIEKAFMLSRNELPLPLKLRMAEILLRLMERRKKIGILVILGWREKWRSYVDTPDISQDLFAQRGINIMEIPTRRTRRLSKDNITNTVHFDGAILIGPRGNILHSGTMIEGLRPRATAQKLNSHASPDLSTRFGFKRKVHMRHITAITSSYTFKGTTVFTISEESDDLHIFEGGRILYSTVRGEKQ